MGTPSQPPAKKPRRKPPVKNVLPHGSVSPEHPSLSAIARQRSATPSGSSDDDEATGEGRMGAHVRRTVRRPRLFEAVVREEEDYAEGGLLWPRCDASQDMPAQEMRSPLLTFLNWRRRAHRTTPRPWRVDTQAFAFPAGPRCSCDFPLASYFPALSGVSESFNRVAPNLSLDAASFSSTALFKPVTSSTPSSSRLPLLSFFSLSRQLCPPPPPPPLHLPPRCRKASTRSALHSTHRQHAFPHRQCRSRGRRLSCLPVQVVGSL